MKTKTIRSLTGLVAGATALVGAVMLGKGCETNPECEKSFETLNMLGVPTRYTFECSGDENNIWKYVDENGILHPSSNQMYVYKKYSENQLENKIEDRGVRHIIMISN